MSGKTLDLVISLRCDTETWMLVGMKILANSSVKEHIRSSEADTFRTRTCLHDNS